MSGNAATSAATTIEARGVPLTCGPAIFVYCFLICRGGVGSGLDISAGVGAGAGPPHGGEKQTGRTAATGRPMGATAWTPADL